MASSFLSYEINWFVGDGARYCDYLKTRLLMKDELSVRLLTAFLLVYDSSHLNDVEIGTSIEVRQTPNEQSSLGL